MLPAVGIIVRVPSNLNEQKKKNNRREGKISSENTGNDSVIEATTLQTTRP